MSTNIRGDSATSRRLGVPSSTHSNSPGGNRFLTESHSLLRFSDYLSGPVQANTCHPTTITGAPRSATGCSLTTSYATTAARTRSTI